MQKQYFIILGSYFHIGLLIRGDRKYLYVSRDTTVTHSLNLVPFVFVLFASNLHHFVHRQSTVQASRHGLQCSVFSNLIGESRKMPLTSVKFAILFQLTPIYSITQLLLTRKAI